MRLRSQSIGETPDPRSHTTGSPGRATVLLLAVLALVVVGAGIWLGAGAFSGPQSDVFLIIIDTARRDTFGCYGNPLAPTPNIDAIAADGVRFDQAIATSGWTLPSVASIFTGTWPTIHGGTGKRTIMLPIRDELSTAAEVLDEEGYNTIGFANAAFVSPMVHLDRGFDFFDHRYTYNRNYRKADETIDAVLAELGNTPKDANFFMIHLFDPHLSYGAPPPFRFEYTGERREPRPPVTLSQCRKLDQLDPANPPGDETIGYLQGLYTGEVSFVDAQIGRLVEALKSRDMYDDAMLIVTSDHGEEFWEHEGFEHGHTLYDELLRVPLIIKYPEAMTPPVQLIASQVRLIDIMPTVFDWLEIDKPESFIGESLTSLVEGEIDESRPAFSEGTLYGRDQIALRGERYKYIHTLNAEAEAMGELYDWRKDPGETENLSAARPDLAREMRRRLLERQGEIEDQASEMPRPERVNLSPRRVQELKSLGYIR